MHSALLVCPHVSFNCGQMDKLAQALPTLPASGGLRQRVLVLSFLGCPCPTRNMRGFPGLWNILGNRTRQRGYIILLGPPEATVFGITSPPSPHSLMAPLCWTSLHRIPRRPVSGLCHGSWAHSSLAHSLPCRPLWHNVKQVVMSMGPATGISQDGAW